jgi:hypothetical protein
LARWYTSGSGRYVRAGLRWTPAGMKESSHSGLPRSREDATLVECHSDRSTGSYGTPVLLHQHSQNKTGRTPRLHSQAGPTTRTV